MCEGTVPVRTCGRDPTSGVEITPSCPSSSRSLAHRPVLPLSRWRVCCRAIGALTFAAHVWGGQRVLLASPVGAARPVDSLVSQVSRPSLVSCFGDSHTEGIFGAPWVQQLERLLGQKCRNYGVNAWTAESVARRAALAQPSEDAVVLAGSNDAMMELAWRAGNDAILTVYRGWNSLPFDYRPSIQAYGATFRRLLSVVPARGRIVVVSLPPLGEAASGEAVELVARYNAELRAIVREDPRAVYIPFGESLRKAADGEDFDASYSGFATTIANMFSHTAVRWLPLGQSFDSLASRNGLKCTHDKIHLTEASTAVLLELLLAELGKPSGSNDK